MLKNKIKQMEEGHLNLEKEHQKSKREYEIDKKKTQNPPSHLPEGFALQDAASPMANHGMGKVFCDRRDICHESNYMNIFKTQRVISSKMYSRLFNILRVISMR